MTRSQSISCQTKPVGIVGVHHWIQITVAHEDYVSSQGEELVPESVSPPAQRLFRLLPDFKRVYRLQASHSTLAYKIDRGVTAWLITILPDPKRRTRS